MFKKITIAIGLAALLSTSSYAAFWGDDEKTETEKVAEKNEEKKDVNLKITSSTGTDISENANDSFSSEEVYLFNYQSVFAIPEATLNVSGDNAGLYILDNYEIKHTGNQYVVYLDFKTIKEDNVNFTKRVAVSVMYAKGNKNLWIKYNGKTFKHTVPNKTFVQDNKNLKIIDKLIDLELDNLKLTLIVPELD